IWFWQVSGRQKWVVDYYEGSGRGVAQIGGVLQRKALRFGYTYGNFHLAHGVKASLQAFDEAERRLDGFRRLIRTTGLFAVPRGGQAEAPWYARQEAGRGERGRGCAAGNTPGW